MTDSNQDPLKDEELDAIASVISKPRFLTYLTATGHNRQRAWKLYIWNAQLGEAFHFPIQTAEVGLRNAIDRVLTKRFGPNWGSSAEFEDYIDHRAREDLAVVRRRIKNRTHETDNGQIVAGLSFGFWVQMLQKRHNPGIWSQHLKLGFPKLPAGIDLRALHARAGTINKLRNRISHHEPLIKADVSKQHSAIVELIEWICPITLAACKQHFTLSRVMRLKPK